MKAKGRLKARANRAIWMPALVAGAIALACIALRETPAPQLRAAAAPAAIAPPGVPVRVEEVPPQSAAQGVALDTLVQWITDAGGADPVARAAAIRSLATAPKAQATPALGRVLAASSAEDRALALESLRTIARQQGDEAGTIRDLLRLAAYDGDAVVADSVRAALDDLETGRAAPES